MEGVVFPFGNQEAASSPCSHGQTPRPRPRRLSKRVFQQAFPGGSMQRVRFTSWSPVRGLAALFSIAFFITAPLFGQIAGRITGVVKDQSGAAVAGATVSATNEATNE